MSQRVYMFGVGQTEGDPGRADVLGGKGASLAAMSKAGLPVPPGFTIATSCCRAYLDGGRWPEGLENEVRAALSRLEEASGRRYGDAAKPLLVSVRSGAAQSMPGMMDTILNCGLSPAMADAATDADSAWRVYSQFARMFVKTVASVEARDLDAVRDDAESNGAGAASGAGRNRKVFEAYAALCRERTGREFPLSPWPALTACIEAVFNSWNNERAVAYRREHDVRGLKGTAVTVQSMFPSSVSGIVFTVNPNDAAADEMIVESAYGLGEAIVSGDVHPDSFAVGRRDRAVKRRIIGRKAQWVSALGDAGGRDPEAPSLSEAQIRELAGMALNVEGHFGRPMDIEWGWAGGRFALLQARPIQGLDVAEDVEIGRKEEIYRLRELAGRERKVWVRHNLAETLPAPTPLTWDIVRGFMSGAGGFGRMYRDLGYRPSREVRERGFLELICGRVYADTRRAADLFWDGMPLAYDADAVVRNPKLLDGAPSRFDPQRATGRFLARLPGQLLAMGRAAKLTRAARAQALPRFEQLVLPPYLEWVKLKRAEDLASLGTAAVIEELRSRIARVLDSFGGESLKPGFFGGVAQARVEALLVQLMGREKGARLALALTQGLDRDSTVEQSQWLWDVAHRKRRLPEFLDRYGHRGVEEMELAKPRWREDDSYIRRILGGYAEAPAPQDLHAVNVARRREAEAELPGALAHWGGSSLREELMADLRDAQTLLPYREAGKFYLMMGYETVRLAIVELGRRWDLGRDVFFLTVTELGQYESGPAEHGRRIKARKLRWQSARRLDVQEVIDSTDLEGLGVPRRYDAASELRGEPVAPGVNTGVAHRVGDPSEAAALRTDYVLVCRSTDPAWTALFVHARGLVVEQGGVLSHGAIVARDFGIPAVVCPDALRRIPEGSTVRVDGNRGVVSIVRPPEGERPPR